MNERTPSFAAGCVAVALIAGLGALTYWQPSAALSRRTLPRLASQNVFPGSAKANPRLEIKLLPPASGMLRECLEDETSIVDFQVVDVQGRIYASAELVGVAPVTLCVPLGYGLPVNRPQVLISIDGAKQGTLELPPFPKPAPRCFKAQRDPRIMAYLDDRRDCPGHIAKMLALRPLLPIPEGEIWTARVLETNLASGPLRPYERFMPAAASPNDTFSTVPNARTGEFLFVPEYVEGMDKVRVRVTRLRRETVNGRTAERTIGSFEVAVRLEPSTGTSSDGGRPSEESEPQDLILKPRVES